MAMRWLFGSFIGLGVATSPPLSAQETTSPVKVEVRKTIDGKTITKDTAEKMIAGCGGRTFETQAQSGFGGKIRKAKIVLCPKEGDSTADWIGTLEKASAQVKASTQLSEEAKAKMSGELDAEVKRLRSTN